MKRLIALLVATLLGAVFSSAARAVEVAGVHVDERAKVGGAELVLNGAGLRSKLFFKVYVAALYAPKKTASAADLMDSREPRRMVLRLMRDISADTLIGALDEGLRANLGEAERAALKDDSERFAALMRNVGNAKEGDSISIDFTPQGTLVGINGQARGSVAGTAFGNALLRVWLGEHPAQQDLKQALLGG